MAEDTQLSGRVMQIRRYLDEDAQRGGLVRALRLRGVNVLTTNEAGTGELDDPAQLAYATSQGRVLYSFNIRDFRALHTAQIVEGKTHGGIILAPQQRYSVGEQMRRLLRLIYTVSAEEMRDRIEFLSAWGSGAFM